MTSTRGLTAIALRILALTYLVRAVSSAIISASAFLTAGPELGQWGWLVPLGAINTHLVAGAILLAFAGRLAAIVTPEGPPVQIGLGEEWPRPLYLCCVRIAGVVVVVHGIPKLVTQLVHYGLWRSQSLHLAVPS